MSGLSNNFPKMTEDDWKRLDDSNRERYEISRIESRRMARIMELQGEIRHFEFRIRDFERSNTPYCKSELPDLRKRLKQLKKEHKELLDK